MHFLNQVDEADLLKLMDEEEVAEFTKPVEETKPEVVETVPEITEPAPEEKPKSTNMLPAEYSVAAKPSVRKNGNHLSG